MTDAVVGTNRGVAGQGLALVRILVGFWFAKALYTKLALLGGVLPLPFASDRWIQTMPNIVAKQMAEWLPYWRPPLPVVARMTLLV